MEAARGFKSASGVSQEAALASLRDREGVEESRNFERAGQDQVATVAVLKCWGIFRPIRSLRAPKNLSRQRAGDR